MALAKRTKGKNLSLLIDGEEVNGAGTSVLLDSEDADGGSLVFAQVNDDDTAPQQWFFSIGAVSDYAAGSFWSLLWDNVGEEVAYVFKPYGNTTPTPAQPHFTGVVTIPRKPPIGGEAGSEFTFEARLNMLEGTEPVRVTA